MTAAAANGVIPVERNWKSWLLNPFLFIAGFKALLMGLAFIIVTALLGRLGNVHFDGVLDVHMGRAAPLWFFITEGLIDWLSLALVLAIFAVTMWRKTSRFIDIIGTQALARWPSVFSAIVLQSKANLRVTDYFVAQIRHSGNGAVLNPFDVVIVIITLVLSVTAIVWMVALMYRAFTVSCNAKGAKAIVVFIIAILIGEIISKIALFQITRFIS